MTAVMTTAMVQERLDDVRRKIVNSGGDPGRVRIVAVTKGFGPDAAEAAVGAGLWDLGENYAQELLQKAELCPPAVRSASAALSAAAVLSPPARPSPEGARWHFLGPVQRNKIVRLAEVVTTWHGIDREAEAKAIAASSPGVEAMVQVNVTGSPSRPGCKPSEVDDLVTRCRRLTLDLSGLMTVGPQGDPDGTRSCFRWLARKARELGLRELSMGMSDDFEVAIEEGATTLRLGRTLFGPRPSRAGVRR